jgi:CRP-like cAMP-binding protein
MPFEVRSLDAPRDSELLKGLSPPEIELVLAAAKPHHFPPSTVMTREGDHAEHLFLLWTGRGRYFFENRRGKRVNLIWIIPGQIFGASALVHGSGSYVASTEAVRDSVALAWTAKTIKTLAERIPRLLDNAYSTSIRYLSWYVHTHRASAALARDRLAHLIFEYAPVIGEKVRDGIELDVNNEELAAASNLTLWEVSRILNEWARIGAIKKGRARITVVHPKKLLKDSADAA